MTHCFIFYIKYVRNNIYVLREELCYTLKYKKIVSIILKVNWLDWVQHLEMSIYH